MKIELIKDILKLIGKDGDSTTFDKLNDFSEQYLTKYLKVVKSL